ncbi:MAG: hypothetical protein C0523_08020 [Cytophaga sp.]|nr:hypothetical protein [Cytophaga sp.]
MFGLLNYGLDEFFEIMAYFSGLVIDKPIGLKHDSEINISPKNHFPRVTSSKKCQNFSENEIANVCNFNKIFNSFLLTLNLN